MTMFALLFKADIHEARGYEPTAACPSCRSLHGINAPIALAASFRAIWFDAALQIAETELGKPFSALIPRLNIANITVVSAQGPQTDNALSITHNFYISRIMVDMIALICVRLRSSPPEVGSG